MAGVVDAVDVAYSPVQREGAAEAEATVGTDIRHPNERQPNTDEHVDHRITSMRRVNICLLSEYLFNAL